MCKKIYWPTTKDQLRRGEVNCAKEDKGRSMRLPEDWREYMAVIFRWKMKKLKERFPRAFKLKVSENKS